MTTPHVHQSVGLERSVELRTKELVMLMDQLKEAQASGTRAPQIEIQIKHLKAMIKEIMNEDEVDPRNEWVIKAHELVQ